METIEEKLEEFKGVIKVSFKDTFLNLLVESTEEDIRKHKDELFKFVEAFELHDFVRSSMDYEDDLNINAIKVFKQGVEFARKGQ